MSRNRYIFPTIALAAFLATGVIGGCGGQTPGNPTSTGDNRSTGTQDGLPNSGAPAVNSPVDTAKFESAGGICSALSKQALTNLGVNSPGKPREAGSGPQCGWTIADATSPGQLQEVDVVAATVGSTGLSATYSRRSTFQVFEPVGEIDGLPAVIALKSDTRKSLGQCQIAIGVSNQRIFTVAAGIVPGSGDSCAEAKRAAQYFAQTIKGGS